MKWEHLQNIKNEGYAFCIWIVILRSVECYINHLSPCWHLLKVRSPSAYGTDDRCLSRRCLAVGPTQLLVCNLRIWSRLNYRWVFCRQFPIFWGALIPPLRIIYQSHKFIDLRGLSHFWLQIYNWSTAWPIKILENNWAMFL